jgi:hypothetical protein
LKDKLALFWLTVNNERRIIKKPNGKGRIFDCCITFSKQIPLKKKPMDDNFERIQICFHIAVNLKFIQNLIPFLMKIKPGLRDRING